MFDAALGDGADAGDKVYTLAFNAFGVGATEGEAARGVLGGVTAGVGVGKSGVGVGVCCWMPGETVASGIAVGVAVGRGDCAGELVTGEALPVGAKALLLLVLGASAGTSARRQQTVR